MASNKVYIKDYSKVEDINSVGYMFQNWDEVDFFFKAYSQQFGFTIIKKRVERDNDII
ncbi:89_t:CDS:2, partial [Gigaspora margarita]